MQGTGYLMSEEGNLYTDNIFSYDSWEYYEGELQGNERILKAVSSLMQDKIGIDLFINAYEYIKNEEKTLLNRYTEKGLILAGLTTKDIKIMELKKEYDKRTEQTKITKVKIIEIAKVLKDKLKLERDLTYYEICYIEMWIEKYRYNLKIIELALNNIENLTADSFINKMDKVITEWYDKNLKTYDEIQEYIEYKM